MADRNELTFYGGAAGSLIPFVAFLTGVAALAIAGAPDERGFWPVLVGAFAIGLVCARDRQAYAEHYLSGMRAPLVMTMILAWLLAGVLGSLIGATELVPTLTALAARSGIAGGGFAVAAFGVCAVVSTATGTSLGTLLVCGPLLYPAGAELATEPAVLIGAILGGATFGDNVSPVSDTTIASAGTQDVAMGAVVRSRLAYALPAAVVAIVAYAACGSSSSETASAATAPPPSTDLAPLAMLLAPAIAIALLFLRRHLVEGLLAGCAVAALVALAGGWIAPSELLYLDRENYVARGLVLAGMERAVGVSIFTLLLMGLVAPIEASGVLARWTDRARRRALTPRRAELSIFAAVSGAVLLTTHSVVAILATGKLARELGEAHAIPPTRRANLLDVTVCTYPFLLPYCIPTLLAAAVTVSGSEVGMPRVSPLAAGLHNFHSWALFAVLCVSILAPRRLKS